MKRRQSGFQPAPDELQATYRAIESEREVSLRGIHFLTLPSNLRIYRTFSESWIQLYHVFLKSFKLDFIKQITF